MILKWPQEVNLAKGGVDPKLPSREDEEEEAVNQPPHLLSLTLKIFSLCHLGREVKIKIKTVHLCN